MHLSNRFKSFSSLRSPDFRRLWISVLTASSSNWTFTVAAGWLIETLSHSPFWVGAAVFAQMGPALIVAPLSGVWADRYNRRNLLALGLLLGAGASGLLAVLSLLHSVAVGPIVLLTLLYGAANTLQNTAGTAVLPSLVTKEALIGAVALQQTASRGSEFLGPMLASPLLVAFGPGAVFALCCAFNVWAVVATLRIRQAERPAAAGSRDHRALRRLFAPVAEGLAYVRRTPLIGTLFLLIGLHCGITMSYMGLLPGFVQNVLQQGSGAFGNLMMTIGLGALIGTLLLTAINSQRLRGALYLATALGSGLSLVGLGLSTTLPQALVAGFAIGLTQHLFMALSLGLVQSLVDDSFRGRAGSLYLFLAMGSMALANWGYGALGTVIAPPVIMGVLGGIFVVITLVYCLASPDLRQIVSGRMGAAGALAETVSGYAD